MSWKKKMIPNVPMKDQPRPVIIEYCEWRVNKDLGVSKGVCKQFLFKQDKSGKYTFKGDNPNYDPFEPSPKEKASNNLLKALIKEHRVRNSKTSDVNELVDSIKNTAEAQMEVWKTETEENEDK